MTTHFFSDQSRRTSASRVRHLVAATLLSLLIIALAACGSSTAQSGTTPSGTARGSWAQANYDYANTRDATQSTLSSHNVTQLGVAWTAKVSGVSAFGALATSPVVQNGTVYLQDLSSNVYAIDLQTGRLTWGQRYNAPNVGPNGPAVENGKVFVASNAQTVAALDATTGKELWSKQIAPASTQGIDQQLAAYHGTLYVSTVPGPSAAKFYTGQVLAFDRTSGQQVWSWQAPDGINGSITAVGNTLLIPAGLGSVPMLVALRLGARGTIPTPAASTTPTATAAATGLTLRISSPDQSQNDTSFSTSTLSAPPGTRVTLIYTNDTPLPHDWHLFDGSSASAPSIAQTAIITGPHATASVTFTTPSQPGKYYFQCDVHPFMNGFLIVTTP